MQKISYDGYRFPPEIVRQAIWLYLRFTLSLRDVEDLLDERGIIVSYETVRRWVNHFGPRIAAELRKRRPRPHASWYLDEMYLKIAGRMVYLWRAVDAESEVLDVLIQSKRNKPAALKLMRKLLKKYGFVPNRLLPRRTASSIDIVGKPYRASPLAPTAPQRGPFVEPHFRRVGSAARLAGRIRPPLTCTAGLIYNDA
jgi:transposase